VRKQAADKLLMADVAALPILKSNYNHEDPEVRYTIRRLLYEYQNVKPKEGLMPMIWCLPNRIRYRLNMWDEETKSFDTDLAKKYYDEQYSTERDNGGPLKWPQVWGVHINRVIQYECRRSYSDESQQNTETARIATRNLIKQLRMDGMSRSDAYDLLEIMQQNEKDAIFVEYTELPRVPGSHIRPQHPMSCLLTEPLIEGIFWKTMPLEEQPVMVHFPI